MKKSMIIITAMLFYLLAMSSITTAESLTGEKYKVYLEARKFIPELKSLTELNTELEVLQDQHVLIQFDYIPSNNDKAFLESEGIKLVTYLPNYAWYAKLSARSIKAEFGLRSVSAIETTDKIDPCIIDRGIASRGILSQDQAKIYVVFFSDVTLQEIDLLLAEYGSGKKVLFDTWEVTISLDKLLEFASHDIVQWIEDIPPGKIAFLNVVRNRVLADTVHGAPYNLRGNGYTAAMWDAGAAYAHTDYASRLTIGDGSGDHYHPTLVLGIMAGDGSRSQSCGGYPYQWKGIAIEADIVSYEWNNPVLEHNGAINTYGADVSQNAWGSDICHASTCDEFGKYVSDSRNYDWIVRGLWGDMITIVGSAGNDGQCTVCSDSLPNYPYGTVVGPIATTKNAISVSASLANNDGWWISSSRGPTLDGRIKPDLAAPGCKSYDGIKSTYTNNCYNSNYCGTSFSSPVVSGAAILLYEAYNNYYSEDPLPSTIRGIMYHSAYDLGNTGPDYMYGYGRIDVQKAVDIVIDDMGYNRKIIQDEINTSEVDTFEIIVGEDQTELKVTLVWDDKESGAGVGKKLSNDLDLVLESPLLMTYYPWVLDPEHPSWAALTGVDTTNNMEQVLVNSPDTGVWIVKVSGTTVPYAPQLYSLIGDFGGQAYEYLPGDVNMFNGSWPASVIGGDVTYLVNYFRGLPTSISCLLNGFWASADVNGDCSVIGSDVTKLVNYLRGVGDVTYCPGFVPAWLTPADLPGSAPSGWPNCDVVGLNSKVKIIPTKAGK